MTTATESTLRRTEDHKYFLGAEELWGVSAVLQDNRLVDARWFDEQSRSRGTAVHEVVAQHARGMGISPFQDPDLYGWIMSGVDFVTMLLMDGAEIIGVEMMRHHPLYKFAGTIDIIVRWRGYTWILDFKTGKAAKVTRFQLAAYAMLMQKELDADKMVKRAAVELQEDGGRARLVEYNTPEHFHDGNRFLSYLTTARDRREFGPKEA